MSDALPKEAVQRPLLSPSIVAALRKADQLLERVVQEEADARYQRRAQQVLETAEAIVCAPWKRQRFYENFPGRNAH